MSIRLQVVMSEAEHEEIRAAASQSRMTVSAWVRRVLRDARTGGSPTGALAVREARPDYSDHGPSSRTRFEVDLKADLVETVRQRYHLPTPRAAIEFALRRASVRPMSQQEALDMQGVGWDGDLDALRSGDPGTSW
jgi:Arc/MetJ family transcription regulator